VKTASPISPSPLTRSANLSDGIVAVWNDFLYQVFSEHAKSLYDSGPEGSGVDGTALRVQITSAYLLKADCRFRYRFLG